MRAPTSPRPPRARATSTALVATTIGAVAGPNLITPMGTVAQAVGLPALAGPFLLSALAYLLAAATLLVFLRPDPLLVARELDQAHTAKPGAKAREHGQVDRVGIAVGAAVMVVGQIVMVAIMAVTPVHVQATGHTMGAVGLVIGLHVAAMYLPSPITGWMVDHWGRAPVAAASALVLAGAGVTAFFAHTLPVTTAALVLLGLGWSLGLIAGSAYITDSAPRGGRARVQGGVDVAISLAGAGASTLSGVLMAGTSYAVLGLVGAGIGLAILPVLAWARRARAGGATAVAQRA